MANAQEKINGLLSMMGGGSEQDRLKMLLYYGDLSGEFADDEDWGALCEFAIEADEEVGGSDPYIQRYSDLVGAGKFPEALSAMLYDLRDNKIFAAMGIHRIGLPKSIPLIPAAAYNKHAYQGLRDEFAVVRFLEWAGFDLNQPNPETGMTALHKFASTQVAPFSHPRAVAWLLEHGADVEAANSNGDTPLVFLCASKAWGQEQDRCFELLVEAGADISASSKDGATPISLLDQMQLGNPTELRAARLAWLRESRRSGDAPDGKGRVAGAEADHCDGDEPPSTVENMVKALLMCKRHVHEIRDFYCDEDAQAENREKYGLQAWDESSGEQYLKRIYQVTMGFAIRNNFFGRPEFYQEEVLEIFRKDPAFANLFDPGHVIPMLDSFRTHFAAKILTGLPGPDQEKRIGEAISSWRVSPGVRGLVVMGGDGLDEGDELSDGRPNVDAMLIDQNFGRLEKYGFGAVARMASFVHLEMLFSSGWGNPFAGVRSKGSESEIPDALATRVAARVINSRKASRGLEGRALAFALQSYAMQRSQGLLVGQGLPEELFMDVPEELCCEAMGMACCELPVVWGLRDEPCLQGEDVELEKPQLSPELQAFMDALRESVEAHGDDAEATDGTVDAGAQDGGRPADLEGHGGGERGGEAEAADRQTGLEDASADDEPGTEPMPLETAAQPNGDIPPELMAAAKAYRAKGGHLGAFGRWALKDDPANPNKHVEFDRQWALKRIGTPAGDKIIADARAKASKDSGN